jgi:hypothetical protein
MFGSPGKVVAQKEVKRLAVIKRSDGEILRVSLDQVVDSDCERFHYVVLRPYNLVGPDQHRPAPFALVVRPDELTALRDALTEAIDTIPAHETVTDIEAA